MLQGLRNIGQAREEPRREADGVVQQSVGKMLETRRAEFGLDLRDVSNALRIRLPYLIAIEEGRLDALPGTTYAIGFVRAYAAHLGLDGPAVVERYKNETAALADAAQLVFPSPLPEGKVPSATILFIAVLALAVIYGGWLVLSSNGRPLAELVPALPDSFLALIGAGEADPPKSAPSTTPAPPPPVTAVAPPVQKPALEVSRTPDAAQSETPAAPAAPKPKPAVVVDNTPPTPALPEPTAAEPPTVVAPDPEDSAVVAEEGSAGRAENDQVAAPAPPETPATVVVETASPDVASVAPQNDITSAPATTDLAPPPPPPAPNTREARRYGAENTDARVVIRATDDSWVQIRDKEGKLLLTRVLRVGDSYWAPNESGVVMRTGNAGGLEIRVDGESVPGLGPKGAIRHEIALDAEQLKAGTAIRR
jgi:cytoskeletal protein RodZ